jgi:hypothetical protein
MFLAASDVRAKRGLDSVDALALMLSAICHDLMHEGLTNSFQVNSCSQLARLYNDASVNHHCAVAFELLDAAGILDELDAGEKKALRKLMVAAIMATDSACCERIVGARACQHACARVIIRVASASCAAQWHATRTWCSA